MKSSNFQTPPLPTSNLHDLPPLLASIRAKHATFAGQAKCYHGLIMSKLAGSPITEFQNLRRWFAETSGTLTDDQRGMILLTDLYQTVNLINVCERDSLDLVPTW